MKDYFEKLWSYHLKLWILKKHWALTATSFFQNSVWFPIYVLTFLICYLVSQYITIHRFLIYGHLCKWPRNLFEVYLWLEFFLLRSQHFARKCDRSMKLSFFSIRKYISLSNQDPREESFLVRQYLLLNLILRFLFLKLILSLSLFL